MFFYIELEMDRCDSDVRCNGFFIDFSSDICFFSRCNKYIDIGVDFCYFVRKINLISNVFCV